MPPLTALTPSQVLRLWHRQPRTNEHNRLIAFSNDLARTLLQGQIPEQQRVLLNELNLPAMAYNALRRAGYTFIDEVDGLSTRELRLINHVGPGLADTIQKAVVAWHEQAPRPAGQTAMSQPIESSDLERIQAADLERLLQAFYTWTEDRERMAALLLQAAELIGDGGPEALRALAAALVASQDVSHALEVFR